MRRIGNFRDRFGAAFVVVAAMALILAPTAAGVDWCISGCEEMAASQGVKKSSHVGMPNHDGHYGMSDHSCCPDGGQYDVSHCDYLTPTSLSLVLVKSTDSKSYAAGDLISYAPGLGVNIYDRGPPSSFIRTGSVLVSSGHQVRINISSFLC